MVKRLVYAVMVVGAIRAGGARLAAAACAPTSIQVLTQSAVMGAVVPVTWWIDPACSIIETGLLLGTDPAALVPVGQPIYGQRDRYQQDFRVSESGRYWLAAYLRDESGTVIQSIPRPVTVLVPPSLPETSGGSHGAPPSYDGTDADFLRPAGNPHFASLRSALRTDILTETLTQPGVFSVRGVAPIRHVSSTHRDEVLAQQTDPLVVEDPVLGRLTFEVSPATVRPGLDIVEESFRALGFPRPGLYTVSCVFAIFRCEGLSGASGPLVTYAETFADFQDLRSGFRQIRAESQRSQMAYFIPSLPPGKRLQSAILTVDVGAIGDFTALRLSGKPPKTTILLRCTSSGGCLMRAVWDFTEEARTIAQQGGGELPLTLDQIPPEVVEFEDATQRSLTRNALYTFSLGADYPWRHGEGVGSLRLFYAEDCPKKLTVSVTPKAVRPRLSATVTGEPATVTAEVTTCPPETGTPPPSVEVKFEVQPPQAGSPEAGGHAHNTARPKGTLDRSSCTASIDAQGMGACSVIYHPSEVSGIETIKTKAEGFEDAEAKVTVRVPGLVNLAATISNFFRRTGRTGTHPDNHWGTANTVANIQLVALDFFEVFEATLGINDMSLRQGGMFDICATWNPASTCADAPRGGHRSHRTGTSVDIDRLACLDPNLQGACTSVVRVDRNQIGKLCGFRGQGFLVPEATIHCEWPQ